MVCRGFLQREEGHFSTVSRPQGTVQVGQRGRRSDSGVWFRPGATPGDVAEAAVVERLADQRVVGGERRSETVPMLASGEPPGRFRPVRAGRRDSSWQYWASRRSSVSAPVAGSSPCSVRPRRVQASRIEIGWLIRSCSRRSCDRRSRQYWRVRFSRRWSR